MKAELSLVHVDLSVRTLIWPVTHTLILQNMIQTGVNKVHKENLLNSDSGVGGIIGCIVHGLLRFFVKSVDTINWQILST